MEETNRKKSINNKVTAIVLSIVIAGSLIGVSAVSAGNGMGPFDIYVTPPMATEYAKAVGGEIPVDKKFHIGGEAVSGFFDVGVMVFTESSTIEPCSDTSGNPVQRDGGPNQGGRRVCSCAQGRLLLLHAH